MTDEKLFSELIDMGVDDHLIYRATRRGGIALQTLYDQVMEDCANA